MKNVDPIQEYNPIKKDNNFWIIIIIVIVSIFAVLKMELPEFDEFVSNFSDEKNSIFDDIKSEFGNVFISDDVLTTYNDQQIKFSIPAGFEVDYSEDTYKNLNKKLEDYETIYVAISIRYNTMDKYIEQIKKSTDYFTQDYYSNLQVSEPEEIEVKGNKFKKVVFSYDYEHWNEEIEKIQKVYYAHEIDDKNLYTVEIDGTEFMTDSEIEAFLTIEK